jgi:hypothetical protein
MSLPLGWCASIAIRCSGVADLEAGAVLVNCSRMWSHDGLKGGGVGGLRCQLQSDAATHQTLRRGRHDDLGGDDMLDWEPGPWGLSCIMMWWLIRPRGVDGRHRLESETWCDGLGMGTRSLAIAIIGGGTTTSLVAGGGGVRCVIVTESPQKWGVCLTRSYRGIIDEARMRKHTQISIRYQIWNLS